MPLLPTSAPACPSVLSKTLCIRLSEDDSSFSIWFTNDGNQPQNEIVEGGGLDSLRQKTERIGGTMELLYKDGFVLKLTVPKNRGDIL